MNHHQHIFGISLQQFLIYCLCIKSCVIQEKTGRSRLTSFAQHFLNLPPLSSFPLPPPPLLQHLFPTFPIHQLAWLPSFKPTPLLSHFSSFHQSSLRFLSFSPSIPSPSALLWTWPWNCVPRGLSLGRWFDLWLGKCFEESWERPEVCTGVLCLDLLSAQKMGETSSPLMVMYLNWQYSPVLKVWNNSPSIKAALTGSVAYDSEITWLGFWSAIVI